MVDYKKVIRENIHFKTAQGLLSPQDLWKLNPNSLQVILKDYYQQLKEYNPEDDISLILEMDLDNELSKERKKDRDKILLKFEVIKDVLKTKFEEEHKMKNLKLRQQELTKLTKALYKKQQESLNKKSVEEIQEMISELTT